MAEIKIRGHTIQVDVEAELNEFEWERAKWSASKLIAASPFRFDKSPSFFVNLDGEYAGCFGDSGYYDDEYKSGNFVKLLAFLRNETTEETTEYLFAKYDMSSDNEDFRLILPKMPTNALRKVLPRDIINVRQSPYLTKRGISADIQTQAGVGKSAYDNFVAIPWRSPDGTIANVKYRSTRGKTFFYERNATPIRTLVYGADLYVKSSDDLIVCEAEIDALSWRTAGYNAVAVGGVSFSEQQADILRRLPCKRLVLAGDNDKAGVKFNARLLDGMRLYNRSIALIDWQTHYKDANDVLVNGGIGGLVEAFEQAVDLPTINGKLRI